VTLVVDASAIAAALVDGGQAGEWVTSRIRGERLVAPHLMPVEVANVLRRAELAGAVSADVSALAHDDLMHLPVDLAPYAPFAARIWELRTSMTAYDAWYVSMAEAIDAPLVTIDRRLASAHGAECRIEVPPG
jgi:predicted nucleic acid-binding protein